MESVSLENSITPDCQLLKNLLRFYIFPPRELSPAPLLLLSASQVQEFLNLISAEFKISLNIPNDSELGILLSFEEEGMPKPEFLGQSTDRAVKDKLVAAIELPSVAGDFGPSFRQKMEAALVANRKKSKESLQKRRILKIERQRNWAQSLKRAQCYLGLLPRYSGQKNQLLPTDLIALPLPTLYLDRVAPFPSPDQPIFVSVDLEWNERHHNQITEVGISTLETADIACMPPGNAGENWRRRIRSRHIRVKEFKHIVNRDFVSGCPDKFDFGKSEFVSRQDVARVIEDCFKPSHAARIPKLLGKDIATGTELRPPRKEEAREHKLRPHNVVLVGHGLQGDIACLRTLGCRLSPSDTLQFPTNGSPSTSRLLSEEIPANPIIWDTLDTATMFQALKQDAQPRALMNVLNSLNIPFQNLHNAGNDARYTLEVMLSIIINARAVLDEKPQERPGKYIDWAVRPSGDAYAALYRDAWQAEVDRRVSEEIASSEDKIRDDCRIWEVATGWDREQSLTFADLDGGDAKGLNVE